MLLLYVEDGKAVLSHEKRGIILVYPIKSLDLDTRAFVFSDGTTVQLDCSEDYPRIIPIKKCDSFISIKKDKDEYDSDVLYMGVNVRWVIFGDIFFRGTSWKKED